MIRMIEAIRLSNLEDELEAFETKLLKLQTKNEITRIDLKELEGIMSKITVMHYENAKEAENELKKRGGKNG